MATIALPPPTTAIVAAFPDFYSHPISQGTDGRRLLEAACIAETHWTERPSVILKLSEVEDEFGYEPVPLRIVGEIRVRYQPVGRLKPRPYSVDD